MAQQVLHEFGGDFQGFAGDGDGSVRGHIKGALLVPEQRGDLDYAVQQFRGGGVPLAGDRRDGVAGYHHKVGDIVRLASEIKLLGDN